MRALRTLAAAGLTVSLLAVPALSTAQAGPTTDALPLARQPDGRLPLAGTPWRLQAYRDRGGTAVPGPEVASYLSFGPRFFTGSGGCSKLEGTYGVNGAALSLRPKRFQERDCAENLTVVQRAVESGLGRAASYTIEPGLGEMDDQLVIYSVAGAEVLRYGLDDLTPLDGAEWRLESYTRAGQVIDASAETPGLLTFRPQRDAVFKRRQSGPIAGTTGCNGIVGDFFRRSAVLSLSELELTDAPCGTELAAQEAAMADVLGATAIRVELPADRMVLTSADTGERLEFASQTPLEGTTWWLSRTAAEGGTRDERITLRLEGGLASGDGPCGPYTARYVTDGAFITFTDVSGAGDGSCSERRSEQALISGLRRSVRVERGFETLALADARGRSQLAFGRPFAP
ncbi:MAG: META domain-containing protein [Candidatus Limnocylindrales bacterium]